MPIKTKPREFLDIQRFAWLECFLAHPEGFEPPQDAV